MYIYMYICSHICNVYMYIYTHTYACIHVCVHVYVYMYIAMSTDKYYEKATCKVSGSSVRNVSRPLDPRSAGVLELQFCIPVPRAAGDSCLHACVQHTCMPC